MQIGDVVVDVTLKDIKNIHLSVYPPTGRVRISAPLNSNLDTIRIYAINKLSWIKNNQTKMQNQLRESPREYLNRESHYVWGKQYLLNVVEGSAVNSVSIKHRELVLSVRKNTPKLQLQTMLDAWYREQLKQALPPLINKWQKLINVEVNRFFVQKMKTKWGSCNVLLKNIRLNLDLAKKPPEYLEYIVVHEMTHLLEPTHNARYQKLMDSHMPNWKSLREQLNMLPLQS